MQTNYEEIILIRKNTECIRRPNIYIFVFVQLIFSVLKLKSSEIGYCNNKRLYFNLNVN